jgi:hypothetical protein
MVTKKKKPVKKNMGKAMVGQEPIIITGGSMNVTFTPPFNNTASTSSSEGFQKVEEATNPVSAMMITGLEVQDFKGNVLLCYKLPDELRGQCNIIIVGE